VFIYEETEQMPHFQVAIKGDVPTLLLDVRARIQEGEKARKNGNGTYHEACHMCPLIDECTPAIKAKYLKKDVCLWRKLSATMDDDYNGSPWDSHQLRSSKDESAEIEIQASIEW